MLFVDCLQIIDIPTFFLNLNNKLQPTKDRRFHRRSFVLCPSLSTADITYEFTVYKAGITREETEFSFFQIYPIIILTLGLRKCYT